MKITEKEFVFARLANAALNFGNENYKPL